MTQPLVSVCIITYNHESYIRQALDSVFMQKVNFPWEVIIADDYSTDNTRQIVLEYKNKYPDLVKLIFQETNTRAVKNFLDLMAAPKGKYIAYLEGDDYWTDDLKLQKQFDLMEANPDCSLCYHKVKWVHTYSTNHDPNFESNTKDPSISTINDLFKRGWYIRSSTMFFWKIKLPDDFEKLYIGDYPLHVLLGDKGNIYFINECMSVYRQNDKGISETTLIVFDIEKRKKNFHGELYLNDYLNLNTNYKYQKHFSKAKFDATYSYLHSIAVNHKSSFIKELIGVIKSNKINFLLYHGLMKLKVFFFHKKQVK